MSSKRPASTAPEHHPDSLEATLAADVEAKTSKVDHGGRYRKRPKYDPLANERKLAEKRAVAAGLAPSAAGADADTDLASLTAAAAEEIKQIIVQFRSEQGEDTGPQMEVPVDVTTDQLKELINKLLENEDETPYSFFVDEMEVVESLKDSIAQSQHSPERVLPVVYKPQAVFRVRAVTRCTSSLPGHSEAVLHVSFSPDGKILASGSGDTTVRLWDVNTETPTFTLQGHSNWVLSLAWSPDGKYVASGSMDKTIRVWNPKTGKRVCKPIRGHSKWITSLAWEPLHSRKPGTPPRLASASKDGTIKIWDVVRGTRLMSLAGHTNAVTCIVWGGEGFIYSASQDRTIRMWSTESGKTVRVLQGHGHWVNSLSLSTTHALRTGAFDRHGGAPADEKQAIEIATEKYKKHLAVTERELLVSGSDDFTLFLWDPVATKKPVARLTGHQQPVNFVQFSPDGRYIASASFDGSVRVWNGKTGKFIRTYRSHVQAVYQVCWAGDSRSFVSSSKDSTLKVWNLKSNKTISDLPGHADEVYAVDWSPDGQRVASGGKDRVLRIWRR
jgi:ribosome assembly protein 4